MNTPQFPVTLPTFKAGDTFSVTGFAGIGLDWEAACQFRDQHGNLIDDIDVVLGTATVVDGDGDVVLPILLYKAAEDTLDWRSGQMDIGWKDASGTVVHTSTFRLPVAKAITQMP